METTTGYTFGTVDDIGTTQDLIGLDEVDLLISEFFYELNPDTLLLAGVQSGLDDGYEGTVNRVASWSELGLPYSYEKLIEAKNVARQVVNSINYLGNSEEYRFPSYKSKSEQVTHKDVQGYPDGEALTGYGIASYLGANVPEVILERFNFYANYRIMPDMPDMR